MQKLKHVLHSNCMKFNLSLDSSAIQTGRIVTRVAYPTLEFHSSPLLEVESGESHNALRSDSLQFEHSHEDPRDLYVEDVSSRVGEFYLENLLLHGYIYK